MRESFSKTEISKKHNLDYDSRYFLQNAEAAMKGDIVRGLVELITNCDDSYKRLEENGIRMNGAIKISIERKRKGRNSIIKVLDNAEGMTMGEMKNKLKRVGGMTSGFMESKTHGIRGLMGRGGKECVIFGNMRFQSIKNGAYSEIKLNKRATFEEVGQRTATRFERIDLELDKGNGTLVTLEVENRFKIPTHEKLANDLPKYYSLRDIASDAKRKLLLVDANKPIQEKELRYDYPDDKVVFDNKIDIADYPEAEAHLIIKKSPERIKPDAGSSYWEGGIMVKSSSAIHGITSLSKKIENNPYFEFYFGKVTCPYIDKLAIEYEEAERKNKKHSDKNPTRIIDPLRVEGLTKNHPFSQALYREVAEQVDVLLKRDEDAAKQQTREIENRRTKERFKKLANEASKFIKENIEDIDNIEDDNYLVDAEIPSGGFVVIPGGVKIALGEEKKIYVYCRPSSGQEEQHVLLTTDSNAVELNTGILGLVNRGDGILIGYFLIKGVKIKSAKIKLTWGNIDKYIPVLIEEEQETTLDIEEFQFEKKNYSVKEGKKKNIRIFAQWPEFIHGRVKIKIFMKENKYCKLLSENIILDYDRKEKNILGRSIATGKIKILGLKAGGPITLNTTLQSREITTKIRVKPEKEFGKNFEIKIVDEDLGDQRAFLIENLMKINGRHKNIRRYLGPPETDFIGQDSVHFRLLIAELIADTVARRILELNAPKYKDMDVTGFYRKHREFMNNFLEIAHKIQIPDGEIESFKGENLAKLSQH